VEALEAVESRVHTTPEQCLMSITAIARQAQGIRAGEVIESSLKMPNSCESTTGSTSLIPLGTATTKLQVAAPTTVPTILELSSQLSPTVLVKRGRTSTGWQQQPRGRPPPCSCRRRRWPRP
jgi:hypothetical protein